MIWLLIGTVVGFVIGYAVRAKREASYSTRPGIELWRYWERS